MAKQKRLNKNVVAFLTIMAMILVISVAFLVTRQQSRRDPKLLAESARQTELAGDLGQASQRYMRAYDAAKTRGEPTTAYVVDAARCIFELGETYNWRNLLSREIANYPDDVVLREALLDGIWRIRALSGRVFWPEDWRDAGRRLFELDPNNAVGLATAALGLWELKGEDNLKAGDEAAQKAFDLDPHEPRVALTYLAYVQRTLQDQLRAALSEGRRAAELEEISRQSVIQARTVLEAAVAEHPGDVPLVTSYASLLQAESGRLERGGQADATRDLLDVAFAALQQAQSHNSDSNGRCTDPELSLSLAQFLYARFALAHKDTLGDAGESLSPELLTPLRPELDNIENHAVLSTELDPAMYAAYTLRADLRRFDAGPDGGTLPVTQRYEKMIGVLDEARERTATLRNPRAQLRTEDRPLMLRRGFELSLLWSATQGPGPESAQRLARAEPFLRDARVKYPEHPLTHFMEGQFQVAHNQLIAAISAFQQAYDRAEQVRLQFGISQVRFWAAKGTSRLPAEQLALLYRQQGQPGEALKYAELAANDYKSVGSRQAATLVANHAELLTMVGRAQEALDLLDDYKRTNPDDPALAAARLTALTKLGRVEQSKQEATQFSTEDANSRLWIARRILDQGDPKGAAALYQAVLADAAATDSQIRQALDGRINALATDPEQGRPAARAFVQDAMRTARNEAMKRLLQAYEVELAVDDPSQITPEQRAALDQKRLEIIAANPDAADRAQESAHFYQSRGQWEQVVRNLAELRKLRPDDYSIVEEEFRARLRLKQYPEATELAARLSQHSDGQGFDRAGGATYRGELALAQDDAEAAIREWRTAVQALPTSDALYVRLAQAFLTGGRVAEGLDELRKAVAANPLSFEAHWLLRQVYRQRAAQSFGAEREENEAAARAAQKKAIELNPSHPTVQEWVREDKEEQDPWSAIAEREKKRAEKPDDADNLWRTSELFIQACLKTEKDEAARQKLVKAAESFFASALSTATGDTRLTLARNAAQFFAVSKRPEEGETLLRAVVEKEEGPGKLTAELLLAAFFESLGNPDASEREYQQAQRLVSKLTVDAAERRQLDAQTGQALIGFYERQHRSDRVVEACRWLLDRLGSDSGADPVVQYVRKRLIQALLLRRQLNEADAEVATYLRLFPDDVDGLIARAQLSLVRGAREQATADLSRILEREPENVWAWFSRGHLALQQGRYDQARGDLVKALELVARAPALELEIRRQLVSLYERTKRPDEAETQLRAMLSTIDAQPVGSDAQRLTARADQKQAVVAQLVRLLYGTLKQFERAQKLVSEYMEKDPNDPVWPFELGRLFATRALGQKRPEDARRDYEQAASYYQRAADHSTGRNLLVAVRPILECMDALTKAGRAPETIELVRKFPFDRLPPDTPAETMAEVRARLSVAAAEALQVLQQPDAAREQWQQALSNASQRSVELTGSVADDLRKAFAASPANGTALLRQVIDAVPVDTPAGQRLRVVYATHLQKTGDSAAVLPVLGEVLGRLQPGTPEHQSALLIRAMAMQTAGDLDGSAKTYREVLNAYEDNLTALNNLAYLLVTAPPPVAAPAEALKYAERLRARITADESTASALDTVGWVYFQNDKIDLALAALEEALSLGGPAPTVCRHLGELYLKLNRLTDARTMVNQGLELARQAGDAEEIRQLEAAASKFP